MKTTPLPAGRDPRWPAGRPASPLSAFCQVAAMNGSAIGAALQAHAAKRASTRSVERARAEGRDRSTLQGLNKAGRHGGAYTKAKVSPAKRRKAA